MRPHAEPISISVFNAGGNRVTSWTVREADGIYSRKLNIPDVSEPGVWRIVAHYQGDEKNAATREFQVKKFVMPSFDVSIKPEQNYFLVTTEKFHFTIHASYSYGETIKGAYHCQFGVRQEATGDADTRKPETIIIRGLEKSGSVNNGEAEVTLFRLQIENLLKERSANLTQLALDRTQLYVAVTVIDIASGELQEAEVFIPIVSQRGGVRWRSYSRILTFKKNDASYGAWLDRPSSIWLTAQVVKVLSLVADRQLEGRGEKGRQGANVVSVEEISQSVEYLLSKQSEKDGSFNDPHPVIHREMQGGVGGTEGDVSLTAFVTIALKRSLHHLTGETKNKAF
ncbi:complement C4-B-like [Scleropages formosus]|uniref:complement C4-B-like n=1 Tax=Scleropages formosus TaxID=113540 RepID=UPI0010FA7638|nr:complement C4-B-like [Scleropages formosus]